MNNCCFSVHYFSLKIIVIIIIINLLLSADVSTASNDLVLASDIDSCSSELVGQNWRNDIMSYTIDDTLSRNVSIAVQQSMYQIEIKTCFQYIYRTGQLNYTEFRPNLRCCSHKGIVAVGQHNFELQELCASSDNLVTLLATASLLVSRELETESPKCKCGGPIYIDHPSEGMINSPGYPELYSSNTECVWKFWIATGITIEFQVGTFKLEDAELVDNVDLCIFDFLEIIKQTETGRVETKPIKHCASTLANTTLNYTSGSVTLRFVTDFDTEKKGFQIKYKTYNVNNSQTLCSEFNGGCINKCISDENGVKQQCSCEPGYALATDGKSCEDIDECLINKGGCEQKCRNTNGSYYCYCKNKYSLVKDNMTQCIECGKEFSDLVGEFSSPGYPNCITQLQNCEWTINVQPDHYLKIEITNLSIPLSNRCMDNYFKPPNGGFRYKRRICGKYSRISYVLRQSIKRIFKFRTGLIQMSDYANYTGFTLSFKQIPISELTLQELDTVYVDDTTTPYYANNWLS